MPRKAPRTPKYRHYKPKDLAVVRIEGHDQYLGKYGSPESRERYDRLIAEWLSNGRTLPPRCGGSNSRSCSASSGLSMDELLLAYWKFAQGYYVKTGKPTDHIYAVRQALRSLRELYGRTPATDFGPLALRAIQDKLVRSGLSRGTINDRVKKIKQIFKWAASRELVPITVYQALATVPGLKKGRTLAREPEPVSPVAEDIMEATVKHVGPVVVDMVRIQTLTGCRPGEICILRPCDIDRSGEVWEYRPESHKTEHHGRERVVLIGSKAQAILMPYLFRPADAYCFSPREAVQKQNEKRRAARRTPMTPSQARRRRKAKPKRAPGERYTRDSYRRAIHRACDLAGVERWSPNRLRHTVGTQIRKQFGLEAAQTVLGHLRADVTQVYAERDHELARKIMRKIG